jgi:hypothetical protein
MCPALEQLQLLRLQQQKQQQQQQEQQQQTPQPVLVTRNGGSQNSFLHLPLTVAAVNVTILPLGEPLEHRRQSGDD